MCARFGSFLLLCLLLAPWPLWAEDSPVFLRHVRVTWTEDPATQAKVSWTTEGEGGVHVLHLDTVSHKAGNTPYAMTMEMVSSGAFDVGSSELTTPFFHHVRLESLQPSTIYYVRAESGGVRSQEYWFETAPADERPFELFYGGDSRSDREDRQLMNARMKRLFEQRPLILALWHGGDFVGSGSSWKDWDEWLSDHTKTTTDRGRLLPVIPTRGNHEADDALYNQVFVMPGGGRNKNYFLTRIGSMTSLLTLDSEASVLGDQRDWLEQMLLRERRASTWVLAGYHTPAWPAVKIAGPVKSAWVHLFEDYEIDLVCENDGHALKRTVPIRGDKEDPTGVVYIGEGGLGVRQRTPDAGRWYLQAPGVAMSAHHVQVLSFGAKTLRAQAIGMDNELLDEYERAPRPAFELKPFAMLSLEHALQRLYSVKFSYTVDPKRFDPSQVALLDGPSPSFASLAKNGKSLTLLFKPPLEPGKSYTLRLQGVHDFNGRPLEPETFEFIAGDYPPGYIPEGEDMGAVRLDMGLSSQPELVDMGGKTDLGVSAVMVDMTLKSDDGTRAALSGCAQAPGRLPSNGELWLWGVGALVCGGRARRRG